MKRRNAALAVLGALVLLALHLDFWRTGRATIWLGWLPEELAWRLVWMLLAYAYLAWFTRCVWRGSEPTTSR